MNTTSAQLPAEQLPGGLHALLTGPVGKWSLSLLLPLLAFAVPDSYGLSLPIKTFLCITLWAVISWAVNTLDDVVIAMALPIFYVLAGLLPFKQAMSSWTSPLTVLLIGGLILGKMVMDAGLAKRVALWCVQIMGGSHVGILAGLTLAAYIMALFIPSITGRVVLLSVVAMGVCDTMGYTPKSREATAICLGTYLAISASKMCYLTGAGETILPITIMDEITGRATTWLSYALYNFVPATIYTLLTLGVVLLVLRPSQKSSPTKSSIFATQYRNLGAMSTAERKAAILLLITVLLLMTEPLHKIPTAITMFLMGLATFLPGLNFMNGKTFGSLNINIAFFVNGCMAIGICANAVGADKWMTACLLPLLQNDSIASSVLNSYLVGLVLNFLLTPVAAYVSLTGPISQIAMQMGTEPLYLVHAFQYGLDQYILPYEYAPFLLAYGFGYMGFAHAAKVLLVRMVVAGIFIVAIALPFWKLIAAL